VPQQSPQALFRKEIVSSHSFPSVRPNREKAKKAALIAEWGTQVSRRFRGFSSLVQRSPNAGHFSQHQTKKAPLGPF